MSDQIGLAGPSKPEKGVAMARSRALNSTMAGVIGGTLMLLLCGCDSKSASAPAAGQSPASTVQDPAAGPAGATQSRFLVEIGKQKFPEAKPRQEALPIRFDFSGSKVYAFDYSQQVEMLSEMNGRTKDASGMKQKMDAKGVLLLKSKGDKTGTLVLKDMHLSMGVAAKKGDPERTREINSPPVAIPKVTEDGGMEGPALNAQPLLKLLFPMPPTPLKPGESALVPVSIPFNAMGSPLTVQGTSKVTHSGYVLIDGKVCARLDTEFDVSQLEVPKELDGKYSCSTRGGSVYYYDVESAEFVSGETAILMKISIQSKMPGFKSPDPEKPSSQPKSIQMAMDSDTLIRLARNPAAAKAETERK
jgi:hypothetical protein